MIDDVAGEMTIHLPQPEGHRRGCIRYRNGLMMNIDLTPEELAAEIDRFLADPSRRHLELRDAQYGDLYVVQRHTLEEELLDLLVAWVQNPAPQVGQRPSGVVVARGVPAEPAVMRAAERQERRRQRRLLS